MFRSGCSSYGIEINHPVASLGFKQETQFRARLRMWGLIAGDEVAVREGDFCEDPEVAAWIRKADVVLVNNYIFGSDRELSSSSSFSSFPLLGMAVIDGSDWMIECFSERCVDVAILGLA